MIYYDHVYYYVHIICITVQHTNLPRSRRKTANSHAATLHHNMIYTFLIILLIVLIAT